MEVKEIWRNSAESEIEEISLLTTNLRTRNYEVIVDDETKFDDMATVLQLDYPGSFNYSSTWLVGGIEQRAFIVANVKVVLKA